MRIHDPKLRNMAQTLSLSVFIAFKGTNFYTFFIFNGKCNSEIIAACYVEVG